MDFIIQSQIKVYPTVGDFPATGAVKMLYIDESTSTTYYWTGSAYSEIRTEAKYEAIDVLNGTGSSQAKMSVCYLKTSSSSANTPEILLSNANSEATSSKTIGLLLATLANGATGKLITSGEFDKFDTSAYNVGDRLWLSTTDGQMTTTVPSAPNNAVFIGIVTRKQSQNGRILVAIQNGYELQELHNVSITTPVTSQGIFYNSVTGLWENKTIISALGYTPVPTTRTISTNSPLTGGGDLTADRTLSIPKATNLTDGYLDKNDFDIFNNKQSNLVSGTNIKTINGDSILGGGDYLTIKQYTSAQRDAIGSPLEGYPIFNTTTKLLEMYDAFWGWMPVSPTNEWFANYGFNYFNDGVQGDGVIGSASSGGGPTVNFGANTLAANKPGVCTFITGIPSNGSYRIASNSFYIIGGGKILQEYGVTHAQGSTLTDKYTTVIGFQDVFGSPNQVDGVYFLYDEGGIASGSTASPNWQCVTSSNSVRTFTTTSIPVLGGYQKLRFTVNDAGTQVLFYIDGAIVATHTTNIPTGNSRSAQWGAMVTKATGITSIQTLILDYISFKTKFTTPR